MKLAWLTDIHLNFLRGRELAEFLEQVAASPADAFVVSGDIGESHDVAELLRRFAESVRRPVYFVLGNHDFYFGSIAGVRSEVTQLCHEVPELRYLTQETWVPLTEQWGLVGHDGWADGRAGDYAGSYIMMNDYKLIAELAPYRKLERWALLKALGDEAAAHIRRVLPVALAERPQVLLVTHVPPLRAACWHQGQISDDQWAPHFTCQALGEALLEVMRDHPDRRLIVLCGHTHGAGETRPLDNVVIHTGGAEYGQPAINRILDLASPK